MTKANFNHVRLDDPLKMMDETESEIRLVLERASHGDEQALDATFAIFRDRLKRMVSLRLDRRLQGRIDPSDVVQEASLDAVKGLKDYLSAPQAPLFLWLRYLVRMRLRALHRHHLGVHKRDASLEVSIQQRDWGNADSTAIAIQLAGHEASPSEIAMQAERVVNLQRALDELNPIDREILSLRHFESLTRIECAQELGISKAAVSKRYIRALQRIRPLLDNTVVEES